jgi:hypothetical protein
MGDVKFYFQISLWSLLYERLSIKVLLLCTEVHPLALIYRLTYPCLHLLKYIPLHPSIESHAESTSAPDVV